MDTLPNLNSFFFIIFVLISSIFSSSNVEALVPKPKTFKYVNNGDATFPSLEYGAPCRPLDIHNHPFQLFFYATVIDGEIGSILGLAMTTTRGQVDRNLNDFYRWVWAANAGNPVHENATLTFGVDGNLVLADADGRVAWQTNTANKGVVDLKLLPNGNLVLSNNRGGFVWQSFDHPTDTLLVGQSLVSGGKLLSRATDIADDRRGLYSMVLENKRLAFYYNTIVDASNKTALANKPSIYYEIPLPGGVNSDEPVKEYKVVNVTLKHVSNNTNGPRAHADLIQLEYFINIDNVPRSVYLGQQKYNSSLSFLRLGWDANLQLYTLYDIDAYDENFSSWEVTYTAISADSSIDTCHLPEKCGSFGVCLQNQCVGCPTRKGLRAWSNGCKPPSKITSCGNSSTVNYFKILDVDHFSSEYAEGEGTMKIGQCKKKCSKDCNCVAFFYQTDTSKCLLTTRLGTLINTTAISPHLAYIKY